ncbi:hypothetical protein [Pseudonocardia endophytica]|nr:hypothetical protein [Pseudonocardia endophytica]
MPTSGPADPAELADLAGLLAARRAGRLAAARTCLGVEPPAA